ncbi:hypothetical protein [Arsukibacterium indicum]|uniref:Uncharacterized protein n=1 Tax=Arsukibacterium indicum TaxID=2848612 RepID=A0ABS6MHB0_9GAMM|nr:hypothetical protein [Arsukibacterium indicum]MBV2128155.1 hypothetical protein [Arsukibacterium indicum]
MRNQYGLANPFAVTQFSLHVTNPGVGATPAVDSEVTGAPYARQNSNFGAPTNVAGVATAVTTDDIPVPLPLDGTFNTPFIGLWDGTTYAGYLDADPVGVFSGTATARSYTIEAGTTIESENTP